MMADKNKHLLSRWELVDQVKLCGEAIEKNADDIIGNERYFSDVTVSFKISRLYDEPTKINISRNFFPEGDIEKGGKNETHRRN